MSETKINSSLSSKFKKTRVNSVQKLLDIRGHTLGKFYVDSRLDIVSGEADIYICSGSGSHSGKKFLLKYYRRRNAIKLDVLKKLKGVNSPFVAPLEGVGEYHGHQYVVRPYYEMSALSELLAEGTRFSEEELKKLIIPSIIEGLKAVHDAGILHKDLKPANMIPDDNGEHIVLIDFGISSDAGKNTFVLTQTGMTPFYAAPEAIQGIFHRETDYYALGITIFELFTGFTPFQNPGLSGEEVARLASISKIEFPENFPEDLKKLVLGLTYKDISHRNEKDNPNRRWGYDEVRRWLKGDDVPVPGNVPEKSGGTLRDFPPYRFNGVTCRSENELIRALIKKPELGIRDLSRGVLAHHYFAIDERKGQICEKAEQLIGHSDNKVKTFIDFLYRLSPDYDGFGTAVFGDSEYQFRNVGEFISYIDRLDREGNLYELRHLFYCYGKAFKNISAKEWTSAIYQKLKKMAASIIQFGDLVFKDEEALKDYLENVIAANESTPLNLKYFFLEHKNRLKCLNSRELLTPVINRLAKFGELAEKANASITIDGVKYPIMPKKGEFVKFGSYPQNTGKSKDSIEWLVLDVDGGSFLLLSRYGLDCQRYHHKEEKITWENCNLRKWLNDDFLKEAFSTEEREQIELSEIVNENNVQRRTIGGANTKDFVFCLSLAEAEQYFDNDNKRQCWPTEYASKRGVHTYTREGCFWWLRSPGGYQDLAASVLSNGSITCTGNGVDHISNAVRPAIWVKL